MFELPEFVTLARQLNETVAGKTIIRGSLGNSPHKFVWTNRTYDEFATLTEGKAIGRAMARGRWLFIPVEPGYVLLIGECGGRLLFHPPGAALPAKYHLWLTFADDSALTALTQMWGAYELYGAGDEQERQYVKGMRPSPVDPGFTYEYFSTLIDGLVAGEKRSVKGLLTQDQLIPGLGNAIAQDILFQARLHPRHALAELGSGDRRALFDAILAIVQEAIAGGGRNDERDLFDQPGGYARLMDSRAVGRPCPRCGTAVVKIHYLGGACYLCPQCQA